VLTGLEQARDGLAVHVKDELNAAAFSDQRVHDVSGQAFACQALIQAAQHLAAGS